MENAYFAAGCFWGVEATFRKLQGVQDTSVGYMGGKNDNPTYQQVCTGKTGHAEAVMVTFDPTVIGYDHLLEVFWACHDPTTLNRQGPDVGSQYRSAVFYTSTNQHNLAEEKLNEAQKNWRKTIVTEISKAGDYYQAEDDHQQYIEKQGMGSCRNR